MSPRFMGLMHSCCIDMTLVCAEGLPPIMKARLVSTADSESACDQELVSGAKERSTVHVGLLRHRLK